MKPVLLFDLGDTLIQYYRREEFLPLLRAGIHAAKEALERLGHDVPADSEIERGVAAENYEAKNSRVRPLHKRLGRIFAVAPCVSKEEWLPICRAFLAPIFSIAKIYEDTLPALDAYLADGYRVGILSNCPWGSPSEPWFEELRRHGLSTRCEVAIFCSDVGWRKPAQPMFRRALDHFGCKPEECLFVGDNPRWDTAGARRANMISVLIDRMGHVDVSSGIVIRSLFDLKPVLERLDWELTTTTGISHPDGGDELKNTDERDQQREAPRNRLSRLSEASLRINESLDLDTVLQKILDSARSLTDAWCGVIVSVDDKGQVEDFLASGLKDEETQQLFAMPEGLKIFEYLTTIPGPLRVPDFASHLRSQGLSEFHPPTEISVRAYLGAPIRHRGETVGNIYLAKSEPGQEFTREDEETLVMFASQAALVIGNVRKYRDERRARADLETLIDTSPIGVVVFDVRTGAPVSFNREARRIIGGLQTPGYPVEQLLDVLTFQRADGSEVSLDKVSLAQALSTGETVRAEEIVMQTPDGRSVATLVNATPIRSQDGEVESFVVTLQDLTSLEELGRLRAEFLGMVSHELRVPLTSIKGSAITLLDDSSDLDPAELRQFHQIIVDQVEHMREMIGDLLDVARIATGTLPVHPELTEIASLVDRARNTFLSSGGRNNLDLDLALDLPSVMADRPRIIQVLGNLLSNAAKHSLESSIIRVTAVREDCHVAVTVADEGTGISAEQLPHLFRKFSRAVDEDGERKIGDSGLGLAICKGIVEAHGGRIWAESDGLGQGARFTFTIPVVKDTGSKATTQSPQRAAYSRQEASEESRILVVDDDPQALRFIRNALSEAGFTPTVTADPKEAILLMKEQKPHLVLLDMVLPDSDGIDLMKDILRIADVPVIFVSGYGKDQVIAQAFEQGVADYIVKPFSPTELVARVRAALRRQADPYRVGSLEPYVLGELSIDYAERRVTVAGQPVELTATEYQLLFELSVNAGRVVTYDQLLRRVWGLTNASDVRLIRTPVRNLRRKLGDDADSPAYIFTELRVGYRMPKGQEPRQETN